MWEMIQKDDIYDIIHQILLGNYSYEEINVTVVDLENYNIQDFNDLSIIELADDINDNNVVFMHYKKDSE